MEKGGSIVTLTSQTKLRKKLKAFAYSTLTVAVITSASNSLHLWVCLLCVRLYI